MKVKVIRPTRVEGKSVKPGKDGKIIDVDAKVGRALIAAGKAIVPKKENKKSTPPKGPTDEDVKAWKKEWTDSAELKEKFATVDDYVEHQAAEAGA